MEAVAAAAAKVHGPPLDLRRAGLAAEAFDAAATLNLIAAEPYIGRARAEEARERIHAHFEVFAKWMRDRQGVNPNLIIREGEAVTEILAQINEDPEIGVLVLGAGTDSKGPGPLVTQLSRSAGSLPVPITIVPGDLSKERLDAIT